MRLLILLFAVVTQFLNIYVLQAQEIAIIASSNNLYCERQGSLGKVVKLIDSGQTSAADILLEKSLIDKALLKIAKQSSNYKKQIKKLSKLRSKQSKKQLRRLGSKLEDLQTKAAALKEVLSNIDKCASGEFLPPLLPCAVSGTACDDGKACTANDTCSNGACIGLPIVGTPLKCGIGACERVVDSCLNGEVQTCIPGTPIAEICNAIDDDCDGLVDEDFGEVSCGIGACKATIKSCNRGRPRTCYPAPPVPGEVCNGIDDNCNGVVDEGVCNT